MCVRMVALGADEAAVTLGARSNIKLTAEPER